jgi:P pilus assembly chaperone PapD
MATLIRRPKLPSYASAKPWGRKGEINKHAPAPVFILPPVFKYEPGKVTLVKGPANGNR